MKNEFIGMERLRDLCFEARQAVSQSFDGSTWRNMVTIGFFTSLHDRLELIDGISLGKVNYNRPDVFIGKIAASVLPQKQWQAAAHVQLTIDRLLSDFRTSGRLLPE